MAAWYASHPSSDISSSSSVLVEISSRTLLVMTRPTNVYVKAKQSISCTSFLKASCICMIKWSLIEVSNSYITRAINYKPNTLFQTSRRVRAFIHRIVRPEYIYFPTAGKHITSLSGTVPSYPDRWLRACSSPRISGDLKRLWNYIVSTTRRYSCPGQQAPWICWHGCRLLERRGHPVYYALVRFSHYN